MCRSSKCSSSSSPQSLPSPTSRGASNLPWSSEGLRAKAASHQWRCRSLLPWAIPLPNALAAAGPLEQDQLSGPLGLAMMHAGRTPRLEKLGDWEVLFLWDTLRWVKRAHSERWGATAGVQGALSRGPCVALFSPCAAFRSCSWALLERDH